MEKRISLTVKAFGITHRIELPDYAQATEFIEACTQLAESVGYSPELVKKALNIAVNIRQ